MAETEGRVDPEGRDRPTIFESEEGVPEHELREEDSVGAGLAAAGGTAEVRAAPGEDTEQGAGIADAVDPVAGGLETGPGDETIRSATGGFTIPPVSQTGPDRR